MADCELSKTWKEIVGVYKNKYPDIYGNLNKAASEKTIANFEEQYSLRLPESLKYLYKLHNGEGAMSWGVFGGWIWLSLEKVKEEYQSLIRLEKEYPSAYDEFNSIPIFFYSNEYLYVKSLNGEDSPLYLRSHEDPDMSKKVATSICSFLNQYLTKLNNAEFVFTLKNNQYVDLRPKNHELWPW